MSRILVVQRTILYGLTVDYFSNKVIIGLITQSLTIARSIAKPTETEHGNEGTTHENSNVERVSDRIIATRIKDEISRVLTPFYHPQVGWEGVIAVPLGFISKLEADEPKVGKIQYLIMIKSVPDREFQKQIFVFVNRTLFEIGLFSLAIGWSRKCLTTWLFCFLPFCINSPFYTYPRLYLPIGGCDRKSFDRGSNYFANML